jgi:hypothetical protein
VYSVNTQKTLHECYTRNAVEKYKTFLERLARFYIYGSVFFCHADIEGIDPDFPLKPMTYGVSTLRQPKDTDASFAFEPDVYLVRGHIPNTSNVHNVISLDHGIGHGGDLCALQLDGADVAYHESRKMMERRKVFVPCSYNWKDQAESTSVDILTGLKARRFLSQD